MRLSDGGDEPKKPEDAADDEISDLLTQPREMLTKICNYLDPNSLRALAFSCHYLFNFCLSAKGYDIAFCVESVQIRSNFIGTIVYCYSCSCGRLQPFHKPFVWYLQKLRKWPFSIHISELTIEDPRVGWVGMQLYVKDFFVRNGVKKIRDIKNMPVPDTMERVEYFAEFVKVFAVEVFVSAGGVFRGPVYMTEDVMEICMQAPLTILHIDDAIGELDVDFLRDCKIPSLITGLSITMAEMEEIAQIWKTRKGLKCWRFKTVAFGTEEFTQFFNCFEVLPFDHPGPIDRSRPPVFTKTTNENGRTKISFYFLREDGKVFSVNHVCYFVGECFVGFVMSHTDQCPLALRDI